MLSKHIIYYFLSHGVPALIGFASIAIFTRMLTPEQYGMYALIVASSTIVNAILFEWLKLSLLRYHSRYSEERSFLLTVKVLYYSLAVLLVILALLVLPFSKLEKGYIIIAVLLSLAQAWFSLNVTLVRAKLLPKSYGILSASRFTFGLGFSILFIYIGFGDKGVLIGGILGLALATIPFTMKYWRGNFSFEQINIKMSKEFFRYGFPLASTLLLGIAVHNSDRFIIELLLNTNATGIYSVTYDLVEQSIFTLMMIVNLAGFPLIMKNVETQGIDSALIEVRKNTFIILLIAVPAAIGVILINHNLVYLFLGQQYRQIAITLLPYIAVGALLKGFKLYGLDVLFHIREKTSTQIIPIAIAAIVNVALNFILIPAVGVKGAAIASLIAYGVAVITTFYLLRKGKIPFPFKGFVKIVIASIGMAAFLWPIHLEEGYRFLFMQLLIGVISYCLILSLFYFQNVKKYLKKTLSR